MDDREKRRIIRQYIKEICRYGQMQVFATSTYQKRYLEYQIDEAADELIDFVLVTIPPDNPPVIPPEERIITLTSYIKTMEAVQILLM